MTQDGTRLIDEIETVLASDREEDIQSFLTVEPDILRSFLWSTHIFPKFRLADAFVPDFMLIGTESFTQRPDPVVLFIEIERAKPRLFAKNGDPTVFLTHAIRQVQDWKRWVRDNRSYIASNLQRTLQSLDGNVIRPDAAYSESADDLAKLISRFGFHDIYAVVAGRRSLLDVKARARLSQMSDDFDGIRLLTYDALVDVLLRQLGYGEKTQRWLQY